MQKKLNSCLNVAKFRISDHCGGTSVTSRNFFTQKTACTRVCVCGARKSQEVRGTDRIQRSSGTGFARRLVAVGHETLGDMDPWATSHRETARDHHIRAARFTTIKMGAAERAILLSLVNNAADRIMALPPRGHSTPARYSMRRSSRATLPYRRVLFFQPAPRNR